jgi:hypothetical protein
MTKVAGYSWAVAAMLTVMGVTAARDASAQSRTPIGDVAGGYSFLHDPDVDSLTTGWFASGSARVSPSAAIVGEVAGNYKTVDRLGSPFRYSAYFFGAGPRIARYRGRVRPFGQVLVGASVFGNSYRDFSGSSTLFSWQPGGGVDIALSGTLALRAGANVRVLHADGEIGTQYHAFTGVAYVFGR